MAHLIPATLGVADPRPAPVGITRPAIARPATARSALSGAGACMVLFAGCWLAAMAQAAGHGHLYLAMFMAGAAGPVGGLALGVAASGVLGLLLGALTAIRRPRLARRHTR